MKKSKQESTPTPIEMAIRAKVKDITSDITKALILGAAQRPAETIDLPHDLEELARVTNTTKLREGITERIHKALEAFAITKPAPSATTPVYVVDAESMIRWADTVNLSEDIGYLAAAKLTSLLVGACNARGIDVVIRYSGMPGKPSASPWVPLIDGLAREFLESGQVWPERLPSGKLLSVRPTIPDHILRRENWRPFWHLDTFEQRSHPRIGGHDQMGRRIGPEPVQPKQPEAEPEEASPVQRRYPRVEPPINHSSDEDYPW